MKPEIRYFHSPDVDLESGTVDISTNFGILLQVMAGPAGGQGEESFEVMVCTPKWLEQKVSKHGPLLGRHYLVVNRYDRDLILSYLRTQIEKLEADTWESMAPLIGRIGRWEFEDYSEA